MRLETLQRQTRRPAAETLARAFRDNPLNRAVIQGSPQRRLRSNRLGMRTTLSVAFGRATILGAVDGGDGSSQGLAGVLVAAPPFRFPFPRPALGCQLACLIGQGPAVQRRWARVYATLIEIHPPAPHWYLSIVGVDPRHQGRGVGRRLLEAWLRDVDAAAQASYLETDREESKGLYQKLGFEVSRELTVLGVPVWCMWRPAAGS